jgi:hypothetical protein
VAKLPSDKKHSGRRSGLDRLERLQPHVYGADWRKKQDYTKWRFGWHIPLFGGRLPPPSWLAARLHEIYRFFVPPVLAVIAAVIGWRLYKGLEISPWLWGALTPVILEIPFLIRFGVELARSLGKVLSLLAEIFCATGYLMTMLFTWLRLK